MKYIYVLHINIFIFIRVFLLGVNTIITKYNISYNEMCKLTLKHYVITRDKYTNLYTIYVHM